MATYRYTVNLSYPNGGGPGVNVWHLRTTGDAPSTAGELEGLSEALRDFYTAILGQMQGGTVVSYSGVAVALGEEPVFDSAAPAWTMTAATGNAAAPPVLAVVVNWLTTNASRSGRGRTFVGPLAFGSMDSSGTPISATLSAVRGAAAALIAASDGFADGAIGVYSEVDGVIRDIVGSSVADRFAILTSRRD